MPQKNKRKVRKQASKTQKAFYKDKVYWVGIIHGSLLVFALGFWHLNGQLRVSKIFFDTCIAIMQSNRVMEI